ncbi:hypothetical protein EDB86DRAFT_3051414 [Lactarius hatsudake]|nr:hypothetical protein EDB86DRAFT_3051414 [Lactarius hatsudake]
MGTVLWNPCRDADTDGSACRQYVTSHTPPSLLHIFCAYTHDSTVSVSCSSFVVESVNRPTRRTITAL